MWRLCRPCDFRGAFAFLEVQGWLHILFLLAAIDQILASRRWVFSRNGLFAAGVGVGVSVCVQQASVWYEEICRPAMRRNPLLANTRFGADQLLT